MKKLILVFPILILLFTIIKGQDCVQIDQAFENNWTENTHNISHTDIINDDEVGTVFTATDGGAPSFMYNNIDFTGDWLEIYETQCLCFDFKVDYNPDFDPVDTYNPKITIFTGSNPPLTNSWRDHVNSNNNFASFTYNSEENLDNQWVQFCLPISLCDNGELPANELGQWTIMGESTDCESWDNLIQNVSGMLLTTDYNSDVSEVIYFANFCATDCPPNLDACGQIVEQGLEFSCNDIVSNYTHTLQFQNNTEYEVTSVVLNGITPAGVTLSTQFFNFYQNPILPDGGVSDVVELEIQLDAPLEEALEVCFDVIYLTDGDQCCHYQHCVLLEPVDPCEFLRIEPTETAENCCYEINAVNEYCADFFVGIQMEIQTDGVVFSTYNDNNGWVATPNDEMTAIFWSMEQGNLPLGDLAAMPFCLGGISSASQIPQTLVVSWIAIDPATGEEIAFCEETLEFFCEPCLMHDGIVECSEEGTYTYDYSITNNSDHIANMIVFEVHTPNVLFDPPVVFTILNPGDTYNDLINITSENGNPLPPNMEIEFKAVLYDAEGWCCHLDNINIFLPDCAPLTCDCPSLTDFTQQVQSGFTATFDCQNSQVQFLANDLGPCDEIQWVMQPLGPGGLQNMTTAGDVPAQFDFTPGVQYRVVMSAQAYDENGSVCSPGNAANYIEVISNNCIEAPVPHVDIAYSEHELLLYPVPASTWLKLEVPKDGIYEWSIFNANGQQIDYQKGNIHQNQPHSLDIAYLPEGIFFVRLKHEDGETRQGRFVKVE